MRIGSDKIVSLVVLLTSSINNNLIVLLACRNIQLRFCARIRKTITCCSNNKKTTKNFLQCEICSVFCAFHPVFDALIQQQQQQQQQQLQQLQQLQLPGI